MVSAQVSPFPALLPLPTPASHPPPTSPPSSSLSLAFAILSNLLCIAAASIGSSAYLGDFLEVRPVPWWSNKVRLRQISAHRTAAPFRSRGTHLKRPDLSSAPDPNPPGCSRFAHPSASWLGLFAGFQTNLDLGEVRRLLPHQNQAEPPYCRAGSPSQQVDRAVLQGQAAQPSRADLLLQDARPNSPKTLLGWSQSISRRKMGWSNLYCRRKRSDKAQLFGPFAYA